MSNRSNRSGNSTGGKHPNQRTPNPNVRKKGKKKSQIAKKKDSNAFVWAVVALVVVGVGAMFLLSGSSPKSTTQQPSQKLSAAELAQLANVPAAVLEKAAAGGGGLPTKAPAGTPLLTSNGKPEVLYIGAEFCPYCAGERWPLAQALSRFGTFKDLSKTSSSSTDTYPNTPTLSFYGSSYASDYIVFTPVETADRLGTALQTMTPAQKKILDTFGSNGAIPFLDVGGLYIKNGASVSPELLSTAGMKTDTQVLNSLADPANSVGLSIDGSANVIAAAICQATGGKPSDVCTSNAVKAGAAALGTGA